jgi:AraC-like DNA-binding protein
MCDQSHFTRVFRRIVGMNPGLWRRLAGGHRHARVGRDGLGT